MLPSLYSPPDRAQFCFAVVSVWCVKLSKQVFEDKEPYRNRILPQLAALSAANRCLVRAFLTFFLYTYYCFKAKKRAKRKIHEKSNHHVNAFPYRGRRLRRGGICK